jgi:hypothetical protein
MDKTIYGAKMTLDITKVASQVGEMLTKLKSDNEQLLHNLKSARDKLNDQSLDIDKLKRKISASNGKTTWLVAGLVENLNRVYAPPEAPSEFAVLATDGSHIDVDRNRAARCYLINIGSVLLKYGTSPEAVLESYPRLYCQDQEMEIADPKDPHQTRALDSTLLGIKRGVEEAKYLAEMAIAQLPGSQSLALVDGTLVRWGLEAYPEFVAEDLVKNQFLGTFDKIRKLNESRRVALASYISLPRSTEVVNALRIALCQQDVLDCDRCSEVEGKRACDSVEGIQDQMLFSNLLLPGQRSALFFNQSSMVEKYYRENRVYFFYLRVEDEIARVEFPEWVVTQPGLLDLTHSLVLDQCQRGQGYPVALSEAHEKAVVSGVDREEFWALVDESMQEEKMPVNTSVKSQSKRTRWL